MSSEINIYLYIFVVYVYKETPMEMVRKKGSWKRIEGMSIEEDEKGKKDEKDKKDEK